MRKYIHISEVEKQEILRQHNLLIKEQFYSFGSPTATLKGQDPQGSINLSNAGEYVVNDPHNALPILSIVTTFIPVIGPYLSSALGLVDAELYYKEKDYYNAGLALFFETIPYWGPTVRVGSKVFKIESKFAKELSEKIIRKKALNETEQIVFNNIKKNKGEMSEKFKSWLGSRLTNVGLSKTASEKLINAGIKVGETTSTVGAELAKAEGLSVIYDKTYAALTGASFKAAQKWFLSNKSTEDNLLMNKALENGWKPGSPVPEKYQTNLYKKDLENLNTLDYTALDQFIKEKNI